MSIQKLKTIRVSERVFDLVCEQIDEDEGIRSGWLETFNNCREQGFMLNIVPSKNGKGILRVWACEARNSDDIIVIISKDTDIHSMFNDEAYNNRVYFRYDELQKAADYIVGEIIELVSA